MKHLLFLLLTLIPLMDLAAETPMSIQSIPVGKYYLATSEAYSAGLPKQNVEVVEILKENNVIKIHFPQREQTLELIGQGGSHFMFYFPPSGDLNAMIVYSGMYFDSAIYGASYRIQPGSPFFKTQAAPDSTTVLWQYFSLIPATQGVSEAN